MTVRIAALYVYPVKSCKGTELTQAQLTRTGLQGDRHWMLVNRSGKFLTQRELPRMALIKPTVSSNVLRLAAPGMQSIEVSQRDDCHERIVTVWRDTLTALDEGDTISEWLSQFLQKEVRLVRFHPQHRRLSNPEWTGDIEALTEFTDGYAMLVISEASLVDLNSRLPESAGGPLPMNRFRPNIVLSGLDAYAEDRIYELHAGDVRLRVVKPCTRCSITTTDQTSGEVHDDEPIKTLKTYRWDAALRGVTFGQNVILIAGVGAALSVGQELHASWK